MLATLLIALGPAEKFAVWGCGGGSKATRYLFGDEKISRQLWWSISKAKKPGVLGFLLCGGLAQKEEQPRKATVLVFISLREGFLGTSRYF